jgi:exo-beta-1,3-glucanase (GH17 family)
VISLSSNNFRVKVKFSGKSKNDWNRRTRILFFCFSMLFFASTGTANSNLTANKMSSDSPQLANKILTEELQATAIFKNSDPFIIREFAPLLADNQVGKGIAYGCFRKGQAPWGRGPSKKEILEDLKIISQHWDCIRVYNADDVSEDILKVIKIHDLEVKVMLGVWLVTENNPADKMSNQTNVQRGIELANKYPEIVKAINMGNETQVYWSGHKLEQITLISYIRELRRNTAIPVTTADDYNFWNKAESQAVAAEIDFIVTHIHPLWNGRFIENAISWQDSTYQDLKVKHPGKDIVLGETGWATCYNAEKIGPGEQGTLMKGDVSLKTQENYLIRLDEWTSKSRVFTFLFEAFDEPWKGGGEDTGENEVEKHWGVFYENRNPKESFQNYLKHVATK